MGLLHIKRFLDQRLPQGETVTVAEIVDATQLSTEEVIAGLEILGLKQHISTNEMPLACDQACHTCPLRAVCSARAFQMENIYYPIPVMVGGDEHVTVSTLVGKRQNSELPFEGDRAKVGGKNTKTTGYP